MNMDIAIELFLHSLLLSPDGYWIALVTPWQMHLTVTDCGNVEQANREGYPQSAGRSLG